MAAGTGAAAAIMIAGGTKQDAAAVAATAAQQVWRDGFGETAALVAGCFPRREPRQACREMTGAMLMGVARATCRTLAEAPGPGGPHRRRPFLARAVRDHDAGRGRAARWVARQLAGGQAVLVAGETGDEKSSPGAVGAGRQYSGALGGAGLCRVAVHLTCASGRGQALRGRALYLPRDRAAGDERRELTGVPDELASAARPRLAAAMLERPRGGRAGPLGRGRRGLRRA